MDFSWLWVVPILGILIVVHEMGHFFTAIWLGIGVEEFGIGFPPRMFAIRRKGIDYSINWLPIGGFVKIVGENGDSDDPKSFAKAPAWKRIIVLAAGSFMNLLLAVVIFAGTSVTGTRVISAPTTGVADVLPGQPAAVGGMLPGDEIVGIAGRDVTSSDDIRSLSRDNIDKPTTFVVQRDGAKVPLTITPHGTTPLGILLEAWVSPARIDQVRAGGLADKAGFKAQDIIKQVNGKPVNNLPEFDYLLSKSDGPAQVIVERDGKQVGPLTLTPTTTGAQKSYDLFLFRPYRMVYYSPAEALGRALNNTWGVITSIPQGIAQTFAGKTDGPPVTSIVGISQLTGEVAQDAGISGLLNLMALLAISLFMINLLPLPALDGGRLLFVIIEMLRGGRRIAPEKEGMVHFAGMMVLLALMAIITFFDIQRVFQGTRLLP